MEPGGCAADSWKLSGSDRDMILPSLRDMNNPAAERRNLPATPLHRLESLERLMTGIAVVERAAERRAER